MAMSAMYTTINGVLYHENRGGVETEYVPDTLGSLIQCRNSSGTVTYTAEYWPYGEVRSETGSKSAPWGFVGLLGYLTDQAKRLYVRARHLRVDLGQWITVDSLWPSQRAYGYVKATPVLGTDSSGLAFCTIAPSRCRDLIKKPDWDEHSQNLYLCLKKYGTSKEGIAGCFDKFGRNLTKEQWKNIKDYFACRLASDTDPQTKGGGNPCDPPNLAYGQSCCYMRFLRCLFDCTGERGIIIGDCIAKCENTFSGNPGTGGFKECLALAGPGEGGYTGPEF